MLEIRISRARAWGEWQDTFGDGVIFFMPVASRFRDIDRRMMMEQWSNPREGWARKSKQLLEPILQTLSKVYKSASGEERNPTLTVDVNLLVAQMNMFAVAVVIPTACELQEEVTSQKLASGLIITYACVRGDKFSNT